MMTLPTGDTCCCDPFWGKVIVAYGVFKVDEPYVIEREPKSIKNYSAHTE